MTHQLTLNGVRLHLDCRPWFAAKSFKFLDRTALFVTKSLMMQDTYSKYQEVVSFIETYAFELAWEGKILDGRFIWGEGELSIYLEPAEGGEHEDIDPELVEDLRTEGLRIIRDMSA